MANVSPSAPVWPSPDTFISKISFAFVGDLLSQEEKTHSSKEKRSVDGINDMSDRQLAFLKNVFIALHHYGNKSVKNISNLRLIYPNIGKSQEVN